jgi:hypothetical protein
MTIDDRLTDTFDRGLRNGIDSLSAVDRELFHVQDFIIAFEMGGLSGYLYNQLPDLARVERAVTAMRRLGVRRLADLVEQAALLFRGYRDPVIPTTWNDVRQPTGRLDEISGEISTLEGYGYNGVNAASPQDE